MKASPRWLRDRFRDVHPIPAGRRDPNAAMPSLSDFLCGGERRVPRGARASPSRLAGPKRFQPVPVSLREMPPVDLAIVPHDHYDHLDYPTICELAQRNVPFVTSLGVGAHLKLTNCALK